MCKVIICPSCGHEREATKHHVFPKRWWRFWTGKQKRMKVHVCWECHKDIEDEISKREKPMRGPLPQEQYIEIAESFVGNVFTARAA